MTKVAIHQPNCLPYLGFLYKWKQADVFVILDDAQFSRNRFINRNQIKTKDGVKWLTVPIKQAGRQKINEIELADGNWRRKMVEQIRHSYSKAEFFDPYFDRLKFLIELPVKSLVEFNMNILGWLAHEFWLPSRIRMASEINLRSTGTQRLVDICRLTGASEYVSGTTGADYQDEDKFKEAGIKVTYSKFNHPVYPQLWGEFEPNMSAIDILFNCGIESREIMSRI